MKKILLPISFSYSSVNLLQHAHALYPKAKLTLLYCYPVQTFSRAYDFGKKDYATGIEEMLSDFYNSHIESSSRRPIFLSRAGTVSEVVSQISNRYDLMVMSRKAHATQSGGYFSEKKLFIIAKAKCPVLIMPTTDATFQFEGCEHIWHIKRKETEPEIVAKGIRRLGIDAKRMEEKTFEQTSFLSSFWKNLVTFGTTHDKKLLSAIDEAHETEPIDLIILVDHEQSLFINFLKSDVIRQFCKYDIPILVFPASYG